MELFNKYKNKNFAFITNYINNCVNDDSLALTEDELREQLSGASQSSFEEFLLAICYLWFVICLNYCENKITLLFDKPIESI